MPVVTCVTGTPSITSSNTVNDLMIMINDYPDSEVGLHQINCSVKTTSNIQFMVAVTLEPNQNASFAEVLK